MSHPSLSPPFPFPISSLSLSHFLSLPLSLSLSLCPQIGRASDAPPAEAGAHFRRLRRASGARGEGLRPASLPGLFVLRACHVLFVVVPIVLNTSGCCLFYCLASFSTRVCGWLAPWVGRVTYPDLPRSLPNPRRPAASFSTRVCGWLACLLQAPEAAGRRKYRTGMRIRI